MSDEPNDPRIEDLVVECLERLEAEGEPAIEAMLRAHPDHAPALLQRLEKLRSTGILALARRAGEREFPEQMGDFRLVRRLGEGGMGVVFLAEQISLRRNVALKLVRPENLWLGGARERFRREVDAVARLAHPSIIPVFTVGEEKGVPFFAMEYVAGASLADVIAHFRARDVSTLRGSDLRAFVSSRCTRGDSGSSSSAEQRRFSGSWIECCLSIARDIAQALAHAHERGVLHRDVKPSNVLLSPSGRVLLCDFGLAALHGSERLTRSGAQLGSLAYMAPEQLDGRGTDLGPATDVYALGATLYELLTLELPFPGTNPQEIAARILNARPEPLRTLHSGITSDVETVVATAIDPDPARRYASAELFAADLTNVLELRPILARRASLALRGRRWAQRHPGWSVSIALAALALVAGPLLYAWQQREARVQIGRQRDLAQSNLRSAREAVDLLTRVGQEELMDVPQAELARRKLLESALGFYARLAQHQGDDPGLAVDVALAEVRVGSIHALLGNQPEARAALERAVDDIEALGGARAGPLLRKAWLDARLLLADSHRLEGRLDDARVLVRATIDGLGTSAVSGAVAADDRIGLLTAHRKLADILKMQGDGRAALTELRAAADLIEAEAATVAANTSGSVLAAGTLTRLAQLELQFGELDSAEHSLQRALTRLDALATARGNEVMVREQRAATLNQYAQLCAARGDLGAARSHAERSVELNGTLDTDFPQVARYKNQLAVACMTLGALCANSGDTHAAAPHIERSALLLEELCSRFPTVQAYTAQLSSVLVSRVKILNDTLDVEAALRVEAEALARIERVLAAAPEDATARESRNLLFLERARTLLALEDWSGASASLDQVDGLLVPRELVLGARIAAGCAALAARDPHLDESRRAERAEHCRQVSLGFLHTAFEHGYQDRSALASDAAFEALRGDPEFQRLSSPSESSR